MIAAQVRVSSGAIEAMKWIAVACMVVDHVNAVVFARELGLVADLVGRLALPLFALVFGYNLARPGLDVAQVLRRLAFVGALVTPVHWALFGYLGPWPLNILLTFALAAWIVLELERDRPLVAAAAFVLGGFLVEYWWPGLALVLATWWTARAPRVTASHLVALGGSLVALCVLVNGNPYALLAAPLALLLASWEPDLPRSRGFFLWFYPTHLAALLVWRLVQ